MSATDTPTAALQRAMADLDSDIAAALARFEKTMLASLELPGGCDNTPLPDAEFAAVCTACTDLTRRAGMLAGIVGGLVKQIGEVRIEAGIEPGCPCFQCVERHAAKTAPADGCQVWN